MTDIPGGVEGFSVAPSENRLMYVARVPVEKRSSPEIYPDLDRSKAKIYDDLMERHWNYWDDGATVYFHAPLTGGSESDRRDGYYAGRAVGCPDGALFRYFGNRVEPRRNPIGLYL